VGGGLTTGASAAYKTTGMICHCWTEIRKFVTKETSIREVNQYIMTPTSANTFEEQQETIGTTDRRFRTSAATLQKAGKEILTKQEEKSW